LAAEDPDFNRRVREFAGRGRAREKDAEIERLRNELELRDMAAKQAEMAGMPSEDVDRRMAADPEFARDYVEAVHGETIEERRRALELQQFSDQQIESALDRARSAGMPEQRVRQYEQALTICPQHPGADHGFFDHDQTGAMFEDQYQGDAAVNASLNLFQQMIGDEVVRMARNTPQSSPPPTETPAASEAATPPPEAGATPPPPPQAAPATPPVAGTPEVPPASPQVGQPNPSLVQSAPDMSRTAGAGVDGGPRYTAEEIKAWQPEDRMKFFEQFPGGRREAIEKGVVYVPGLSEELGHNR
jgi:hypothetical protein